MMKTSYQVLDEIMYYRDHGKLSDCVNPIEDMQKEYAKEANELRARVKELDELIECEQCDKKASGYTVCPSCWNELGARVKELESALQEIITVDKQVGLNPEDHVYFRDRAEGIAKAALASKREGEDG